MEFAELARTRYSVRKFSDKPVEDEKLAIILETGRISPTAHNNQPQRIIVCNQPESLEKIRQTTKSHFNSNLILIICYDINVAWHNREQSRHEGHTDASIVTDQMMMQAWDIGIGSTWVGAFDRVKTKELFNLPEHIIPVALLPLGYPADDSAPISLHTTRFPL